MKVSTEFTVRIRMLADIHL